MVTRKELVDTNEVFLLEPVKVYEEDTYSLCGSKHSIQIGITEPIAPATTQKPFNDYFVVYFHPQDTSGGGQLMNMLTDLLMAGVNVTVSGTKIFTDPEDYHDTMASGREAAQQNYNDCVAEKGAGNCKWMLLKSGAFTGFSVVGDGVAVIGGGVGYVGGKAVSGGKKASNWVGDKTGWWAETDYNLYAEQNSPFYTPYEAENKLFAYEILGDTGDESTDCDSKWLEYTGGCYHSMGGGTHKVRITITNTFNGQTITKYDSELAGCNATYQEGACMFGDSYSRFLINAPGTWTIKVTPMATAACNSLDYTTTATYEVAEPEGWKPSELFTMSQDISVALQDAGLPIAITPLKLVAGASLIGGLLMLKIYKKKKAKAE